MASLNGWTSEQVFRMAPEASVANDGRKMAHPGKWHSLGHDNQMAWGEFQGSGKLPYQIKADLERLAAGENAIQCTCPSRKQPCKHCIGLLFILVERLPDVPNVERPAFVEEWAEKQAQKVKRAEARKEAANTPVDPEQQAKTAAERKQKITAGMEALEQWLVNMIRHGLTDPQLGQYEFWNATAARMVDAQAPGLSTWLRELAGLPVKGGEWIAPLLEELGRIYLLTQAFKHFDQLPASVQADLRTAVGWNFKRDDIDAAHTVRDQWHVIGRYEEKLEDKLRMQRLWMIGEQSQQPALILDFAFNNAPFETVLPPGVTMDAEIGFFPSNAPMRAVLIKAHGDIQGQHSAAGMTIRAGLEAYGCALARNPWLQQYPFVIESALIVQRGGKWLLRDAEGTMIPLAARYPHQWALLAISGNHPLRIMGEWDGTSFYPLSVMQPDRLVDFTVIRKLA
ncbi:MAG: SWIM zinc finger family protein [Anaerolineae bacterium]|nr:SWIM zinc finger family protein [Anaerolineae bacterium]